MRYTIGFICLVLLATSCATTKKRAGRPVEGFVSAGMSEDGPEGKRLVIRFAPQIPGYDVLYHAEERMSEIRWQAAAAESFDKEYVFNARGGGIRRAVLSIDSGSGTGMLRIWHDGSDSYVLGKQGTSLVLYAKTEAPRQTAAYQDPHRRRINLNVKNAPLDKLLRTLASESERSMVFGNAVSGTVTATLQNMPYEQAIDMILRPTGYRAEHAGDVTVIRSAKDDKNFRAFHLRHIDANLILKSVQDIISKDAQATVDGNTNTIFVVDRVEMLKNLELMLATMDQEPRQVEVEAAVVEVDRENDSALGFNYGGIAHLGSGGQVVTGISQSRLGPFNPTDPAPKGMFVNLSWQSVTSVLSLLASSNRLNLLARPRVLALSDQEASVIIGSKLGYKTVTVTTTGTIQDVKFLVVGTQLKLKPHITESGDILMAITPEISDGSIDPTTGIPSEKTTTSDTKVLAHDGQTIIMGGLMRDRVEKSVDKIPLLGDLPLLGFFFSGTTETRTKTEIVILLTPKLVTPQVLSNQQEETGRAVTQFYEESGVTPPGR